MRKLRNLVIMLALLGVTAFVTNPEQSAFDAWMKAKAKQKLDENAEEGLFGGKLNAFFGNVLGGLGTAATTRGNFHVASLYTVDLGSKEYCYLGVFTTFIPLQLSDPISDMLDNPDRDE